MEFRLTYDGPLKGNGDAKHKHELRKAFHKQLMHLWRVHPTLEPYLLRASPGSPKDGSTWHSTINESARRFEKLGYCFFPLAQTRHFVLVTVDILFLRPGAPGSIVKSGDIDNRLKTIFDALRMPQHHAELGGYDSPGPDETPFFCLLEDDKLIWRTSVETDALLQVSEDSQEKHPDNFARLVIRVEVDTSAPQVWTPFRRADG